MNEVTKQIPISKLDDWFFRLDAIAQPKVSYDADSLKMANECIEGMRAEAASLCAEISFCNSAEVK